MASYLLSLADMHASGPGSLEVIFGPDGEHEDAPLWLGPIWAGNRNRYLCPFPWSATHTDASSVEPEWVAVAISGCIGERWEHDGVALDLRIPSVFARVVELCARAMGGAGGGWWLHRTQAGWGAPAWALYARVSGPVVAWTDDGRVFDNLAMQAPMLLPVGPDLASTLAALALFLAPRIAALKPTQNVE